MAESQYFSAAFIEAASVPLDAWHASGSLDHADSILSANPEIGGADIYTAAILGDAKAIRRFLDNDPACANRQGGPRGWDPLTYLCFSRYLKLDSARSSAFVESARLLLEAGASAQTGWWERDHSPRPEWESALYGAAGVAHHPGVTRLLLDHGADPNDGETVYHTPETYDNRALKVLVESGKLTPESLSLMLTRKYDWHDREGANWLMDHGADPNHPWRHRTPMYHAILRDNDLDLIEASLDHGGDPTLGNGDLSCIMLAARKGRRDLLQLFHSRGFDIELTGVDKLLAACAMDDDDAIGSAQRDQPESVHALIEEGGRYLALFTGVGNVEGVRRLLDLGVSPDAIYAEGDGYFGIAPRSTALHVAAWRMRPEIIKLLIERGASVNASDDRQRTPLMLAVRACVDSYWQERRSPESVHLLLDAEASVKGVEYPSGYDAVDQLLRSRM